MSIREETRPATDTVTATLNYVSPDTKISRRFCFPGDEVNTGRFLPHPVTVRNARTAGERIALDTHGFELFRHKSAVTDFRNRAEIEAVYAQEVLNTVKAITGADFILPLGHVMRIAADTSDGRNQPPASDVHVDMSPETAPVGARAALEQAMPGQTYRRFLASSFWRPFSEPPQDWPLALCDHRSIAPAEGVPNRRIWRDQRPTREEMFGPLDNEDAIPAALVFRHGPHHRWFYYPDMTRDEAILIKLHDSDHARAWFAPHTAFHDEARSSGRTRESIEFRTFAYWL